MRYELLDLHGGGVRRFASMRALAQYVAALQWSDAAHPSAARVATVAGRRARKRS